MPGLTKNKKNQQKDSTKLPTHQRTRSKIKTGDSAQSNLNTDSMVSQEAKLTDSDDLEAEQSNLNTDSMVSQAKLTDSDDLSTEKQDLYRRRVERRENAPHVSKKERDILKKQHEKSDTEQKNTDEPVWNPSKSALQPVDWKAMETEIKEGWTPDQKNELDENLNNLADYVGGGNWAFVNENHTETDGFVMARLLIEKSETPGFLLLEAPYSLNWQDDFIGSINHWGLKGNSRHFMGALAKYAYEKGWDVIPVDSTHLNNNANDTEALEQSNLPGSDSKYQQGKVLGGVLRQNYIARNVHNAMTEAKTLGRGGILLMGGKHITGSDEYNVEALSKMVANQDYNSTEITQFTENAYAQKIVNNPLDTSANYSQIDDRLSIKNYSPGEFREMKLATYPSKKGKIMMESMKKKTGLTEDEIRELVNRYEEEEKRKKKKKSKNKDRNLPSKGTKSKQTVKTPTKAPTKENLVQTNQKSRLDEEKPTIAPTSPSGGNGINAEDQSTYLTQFLNEQLSPRMIDSLTFTQRVMIYDELNNFVSPTLTRTQMEFYNQLGESIRTQFLNGQLSPRMIDSLTFTQRVMIYDELSSVVDPALTPTQMEFYNQLGESIRTDQMKSAANDS